MAEGEAAVVVTVSVVSVYHCVELVMVVVVEPVGVVKLVAVLMVVMVTAMRDHLNEALATTVAPRILHKESATIPGCGEGQGQGHG